MMERDVLKRGDQISILYTFQLCIKIINLMFDQCKTVNVYNIENHYHIYPSNQSINPNQCTSSPGIISQPSKYANLNLLTPTSKRNIRANEKKGLNLCKNLVYFENHLRDNQTSQIFTNLSKYSHKNHQSTNCKSPSSHVDLDKTKSFRTVFQKQQLIKPVSAPLPSQRFEPRTIFEKNNNFRQSNCNLISGLYQTRAKKDIVYKSQEQGKDKKKLNRKISITEGKKNYSESLQLSSSRNNYEPFELNPPLNTNRNSSRSSIGTYHKYTVSRSLSSLQGENNKEPFTIKINEISQEIKEAEIVLSNILSRDSDCYSKSSGAYRNFLTERKFHLEDRHTILSCENQLLSEGSLKIQQSELYEMDAKNNFTIINFKSLKTSTFTVDLAVQNHINCLVSLKQISFRQMKAISQQLQIYQLIQQKLRNRNSSQNILQLYQVQMTSCSYIMIKQPYTNSISDYCQKLNKQQISQFALQTFEIIKGILVDLQNNMVYATRPLNESDFVVCEKVVKLHNMSVFSQHSHERYKLDEILKGINLIKKFIF